MLEWEDAVCESLGGTKPWKPPGCGLPAASWIPQEPKASAHNKVWHPHL